MSDACPVSEPPPTAPSGPVAQPWPHPRQRAWVEVNEAALEANARRISRSLAPGSSLMAVVKADGYGHGAVPVARAAATGGASCFGVATLQEGVELRQAGLQQPVLVLGNLTH
ncbi:MAG: alanine racemase, partial [Vulcanococcus sp.]